MGISKQSLAFLLSEQAYRPITGRFLCIGKHTVNVPPDTLFGLLEAHDIPTGQVKESLARGERDTKTRHAGLSVYDHDLIAAISGGKAEYNCLDVSDYEGADIIQDMTRPISDALEGQFDFIYNGSCMDNIFDPVSFIKNTSRMLKPGGRVIHVEGACAVAGAYLMFSPEWFFSYYAVNDFVDCKVYATVARESSNHPTIFDATLFHWRPYFTRNPDYDYIEACKSVNGLMHVMIVAEKGPDSASDRNPMQSHYLGEKDVDWREKYADFSRSGRPLLRAPRRRAETVLPLLTDHFEYLGDGL